MSSSTSPRTQPYTFHQPTDTSAHGRATQLATAGAPSPGREPDARDPLALYLGELARHSTFSPAEEVAAALEVEAAEVNYWIAVLSCPAVLPTLVPHLEALCAERGADPNGDIAQKAPLRTEVGPANAGASAGENNWSESLARVVRRHDVDRDCMRQVHASARDWWRKEQASNNTQRVARARSYQRRTEHAFQEQNIAKQRFVAANLRLVVVIAKRYQRGSIPLADLIQDGNLGLMKAVERFDASRGFRFSTYASWWIRHAVSRAVADTSRTVRLPVGRQELLRQVKRATQKLQARTGRPPSSAELAKETALSLRQVDDLRSRPESRSLSLDRPVANDDSTHFVDLLADDSPTPADQGLLAEERRAQLARALTHLNSVERRILRRRFGMDGVEELTLRELGLELSLSRERVRQLQNRALSRLRAGIEGAERLD